MSSTNKFIVESDRATHIVSHTCEEVYRWLRQTRRPLIPGAIRNLSNWMARLVRGNAVDDRPPIWDGVPRERVKRLLDARVKQEFGKVKQLDSRLPGAADFWVNVETDQAKNLGPSSEFVSYLYSGEKKISAVYSDKPLSKLRISEAASQKAMRRIAELLPAQSLRAVSLESVRPGDPANASRSRLDGSTNSGEPAWISDWWKLTRDDTAHVMYRDWLARTVKDYCAKVARADSFKEVIPYYLATAGIRIVSKGPEPLKPVDGKWKNPRFVIAMPKTETWPGKTLFVPEQQALLKVRNRLCPTRIFSGWLPMPQLDKNVQALLEYAHSNKLQVVSGDLSSFDATVPPAKWWELKQCISNWFDDESARLFLAISYADIYNTALITPTKIWPAQPSSVKSGSIFTNVDDSLFNLYVQYYGYYAGYYGEPVSCVNGDDIIAAAPGMTKEALGQAFADHGMILNEEKTMESYNMCHYLQRTHYLGIPGGMGSIYRVLVKCLALEDDTTLKYDERNRYAYIVQALFRLENACFNPLFNELVNVIAQGDSLHLGSALPVDALVKRAGEYAVRKLVSTQRSIWSPAGSGVPFKDFAVNRVLRGEVLPPPGIERFENIYRVKYSSVNI